MSKFEILHKLEIDPLSLLSSESNRKIINDPTITTEVIGHFFEKFNTADTSSISPLERIVQNKVTEIKLNLKILLQYIFFSAKLFLVSD